MKRVSFICLLLLTNFMQPINAQDTIDTLYFEGFPREYIIHVPSSYDSTTPTALIIALHGIGSQIEYSSPSTGLNGVSDTAGFIVIYPQAYTKTFFGVESIVWNDGSPVSSGKDDIGFIKALKDSAQTWYNIDTNRVYVAGFSMGCSMLNTIICDPSNSWVKAAAPVANTLAGWHNPCNPNNIPVIYFHSVDDNVNAYEGSFSTYSADSVMKFWVTQLGCYQYPIHDLLPDTSTDGSSRYFEHYYYGRCNDNVAFRHFKGHGVTHQWLADSTKGDINYAIEIWKFFNNPHYGLDTAISNADTSIKLSISTSNSPEFSADLFPNPSEGEVTILFSNAFKGTLNIYSEIGILIGTQELNSMSNSMSLNFSSYPSGVYFIRLMSNKETAVIKLLIN